MSALFFFDVDNTDLFLTLIHAALAGVFGAAPARFFGAAGHHKPQTIALTFFHMPTARKYFVAHAEVGSTVFEVAKKYDIPIIGSYVKTSTLIFSSKALKRYSPSGLLRLLSAANSHKLHMTPQS